MTRHHIAISLTLLAAVSVGMPAVAVDAGPRRSEQAGDDGGDGRRAHHLPGKVG